MSYLANLKNTHRPKKKVQRVGRGPGSNRGKTSGRGSKGDKSRSGYKTRRPQEGGQLPLFRKLPTRGFTRGLHIKKSFALNLSLIEALFQEGETVNYDTLRKKGIAPRLLPGGIRILGQGELKKKVTIEAHHFSKTAKEKLEKSSISFKEIPLGKSKS
ncbi:MAG: 50S ribosomal protein L15 [Chlamydiae bacterium]|nr:50S ribosomal protein L15 [Chlamydiota bacterium]